MRSAAADLGAVLCVAWSLVFTTDAASAQGTAAGDPIAIDLSPIEIPERLMAGQKARFLAGFELGARNSQFGGLSGLALEGERFYAIGDRAIWIEARAARAESGAVTGLSDARIGALKGSSGNPLKGTWIDAESLTRSGSGGFFIGFERRHRITEHRSLDGKAVALVDPPPAKTLGGNAGIEGLARAPDGALWALAEAAGPSGRQQGWRLRSGAKQGFGFARIGAFDTTGADFGPDGALYVLERSFSLFSGVGMRIRRFSPEAVAAVERGASADLGDGEVLLALDTRAPIDNMEGLAVERRGDGVLVLTAISDDNFNAIQRTVLLQFVVEPSE